MILVDTSGWIDHDRILHSKPRYGSKMRKYLPDFIVLVDDLGTRGRWAFVEPTDVYQMEAGSRRRWSASSRLPCDLE